MSFSITKSFVAAMSTIAISMSILMLFGTTIAHAASLML